jgi:outer membrane protein OmpA-like peptidoglycan-associated protein
LPTRESLSRFAGIVASYPDIQFSVEGHTDSTGSVTTNEELSVRRALAVRDYLISQGIGVARIDARGFAATQPIADNATSEGRARNRRVEIVLTGGHCSATVEVLYRARRCRARCQVQATHAY